MLSKYCNWQDIVPVGSVHAAIGSGSTTNFQLNMSTRELTLERSSYTPNLTEKKHAISSLEQSALTKS